MPRHKLEIADIFRTHGPAWRRANAGHVSFGQLKVMSAPFGGASLACRAMIETCRTEALGGHVYAKQPILGCPTASLNEDSAGPEAVLTYLSRYTHRVAISNNRLVSADSKTVAFKWKNYRIKNADPLPGSGLPANHERGQKIMRLATGEFIRRFHIHVLPDGFHRIRHYGLMSSASRKTNIAMIRILLRAKSNADTDKPDAVEDPPFTLKQPCPDCGSIMRIIETFKRRLRPKTRAPPRKDAA